MSSLKAMQPGKPLPAFSMRVFFRQFQKRRVELNASAAPSRHHLPDSFRNRSARLRSSNLSFSRALISFLCSSIPKEMNQRYAAAVIANKIPVSTSIPAHLQKKLSTASYHDYESRPERSARKKTKAVLYQIPGSAATHKRNIKTLSPIRTGLVPFFTVVLQEMEKSG